MGDNNTRIVEILEGNLWIRAQKGFESLEEGCVFRLFEEEGEPVLDGCGWSDFLAYSDSFQEDGVWTIMARSLQCSEGSGCCLPETSE